MFRFVITQTIEINSIPVALLQWGEDQIERALLYNTPDHLKHVVRDAWRKTISDFKKESIRL